MQSVISTYADQALYYGLTEVVHSGLVQTSRNGPVLRTPMPLASVYADPRNRVLFNPVRDCNPFLHVFESMWMLKGRRDLAFVQHFTPQMKAYSDDGVTLNGAYGYRWRRQFGVDQINFIIQELLENPDSRRAHLQMWDAHHDTKLLMTNGSKDVPCNLSAEFEVSARGKVDMVVYNRSNDLIWGAYGANLVHFSFLQEYIACALGRPVGTYTQVSRNAHIYTENPVTHRLITKVSDTEYRLSDEYVAAHQPGDNGESGIVPEAMAETPLLFNYGAVPEFEHDLTSLFHRFDGTGTLSGVVYETKFGRDILDPLGRAHDLYKQNKLEAAADLLGNLDSDYDWILNAQQWIDRRIVARKAKESANG